MDNFILQDWIVLVVTAIIVFVVVFALRWLLLFKPASLSAEERLPRQLAMLGITIVSIIVIVLALPVSESYRNQLLGLFGVLLSGVIAFSSTTIVSNLMAG
jgi:small conductance mechanosensitive channel